MANTKVLTAKARGLSLHMGLNGVSTAKSLTAGDLFDGQRIDDALYFELSKFNGMPASQSPNLFVLGQATTFLAQTPFSV